MTSPALNRAAMMPAAAVPAPRAGSAQAGGVVPAAGQGFVPAGAAAGAPPAPSSGQPPTAGTPTPKEAPASAASADAAAALPQILEQLQAAAGDDFGAPIVAADGSIYMQRKKLAIESGKVALTFVLVGKVDRTTGKLALNEAFARELQSKPPPGAKPVKVGDQMFWQVMAKGEDGKLSAKMTPMSEGEVQQLQAAAQQQQVEQEAQAKQEDQIQWIQKLSTTSTLMRAVGYTGAFVDGISRGPDPITGKHASNWYSGYMALQYLDAQSQGKLLPKFLKQGPFATALDWGIQGLFMLDMGQSWATIAQAYPRLGAAMHAFTSPTRAVLGGVASLGKGIASATAPAAAGAVGVNSAAMSGAAAARLGLAAESMQAAGAAGGAAGATNSAMKGALTGLGTALREGKMGVVGAGGLADKATLLTAEGALSMAPKSALQQAMKLTEAPVSGPVKFQNSVMDGIGGAFSALRPMLKTLQIGGSVVGAVAGAINVSRITKAQGVKSLFTTQDGRGALFSLAASASFLSMYAMPALLGPAALPVGFAAMNIASNVFGGLSMLNYAGFFGDGGWLDSDAVRAAFLIPPLTPIGLAGLWMKRRKKREDAKIAQLKANQQTATQQFQTIQKQATQQLQQAGNLAGAIRKEDGTLVLPTPIPEDLSQMQAGAGAGSSGGPGSAPGLSAEAQRTLQLQARPMRM